MNLRRAGWLVCVTSSMATLVGCGAAAPAPAVAIAEPDPIPAEALELVAHLTPVTSSDPIGEGVLGACLARGANGGAWDPSRGGWVVLDVDTEMGEPPAIDWLGVAAAGEEEPVDAGDLAARYAALPVAPDLIEESVEIGRWYGAQSPLVRAEGRCLYVESGGDRTEDVLHLFDCDGTEDHVLARRPSSRGPVDPAQCSGEAHPGSALSCMEIAASLSIASVRRSPDRSSLLVQGYAGPPDHPAAGPFHWVVAVADDARR